MQLHNLESILGDLRGSSSDFYPDQAGGGGANDTGNKPQGCLDDSLQGKWFKDQKPIRSDRYMQSGYYGVMCGDINARCQWNYVSERFV